LVAGHGRHPAAARVNGKPVVFFTATQFSVDMWKSFFGEYHAANIKSFNLVEGYDPALLAHFDGLYWNPACEGGTKTVGDYAAAYVHARFGKKAFAARLIGKSAVNMKPSDRRMRQGLRPTWAIAGDVDICRCVTAEAPTPEATASFTLAGYVPQRAVVALPTVHLRKHSSRGRLTGYARSGLKAHKYSSRNRLAGYAFGTAGALYSTTEGLGYSWHTAPDGTRVLVGQPDLHKGSSRDLTPQYRYYYHKVGTRLTTPPAVSYR